MLHELYTLFTVTFSFSSLTGDDLRFNLRLALQIKFPQTHKFLCAEYLRSVTESWPEFAHHRGTLKDGRGTQETQDVSALRSRRRTLNAPSLMRSTTSSYDARTGYDFDRRSSIAPVGLSSVHGYDDYDSISNETASHAPVTCKFLKSHFNDILNRW